MKTLILKIDPGAYDSEAVWPVIEIVRRGGVVVYPTETFYGLGVDAFSAAAVRKVYALKERDRGKPLSIVVAGLAEAESVAAESAGEDSQGAAAADSQSAATGPIPILRRLAAEFWPGPLTIVVKAYRRDFSLPSSREKSSRTPLFKKGDKERPVMKGGEGDYRGKSAFAPEMLGPGGTVALRVPGSAWLRAFLGDLGVPLTATSANLSGAGEISDPAEIIRLFQGKVEAIVDGGTTPGGLPSTVLDLTSNPPKILREGAVPSRKLVSRRPR